MSKSISAVSQVEQSAREASEAVEERKAAMADLDGIIDAAGKASANASYANFVGTITINRDPAVFSRIPLFLECLGTGWHKAFISYVAQAERDGNTLHCDSEAEAQELDIKSGKDLGFKSPDNPRMGHQWGCQLLGIAAYEKAKATRLIKAGFKDATFAVLKVTK